MSKHIQKNKTSIILVCSITAIFIIAFFCIKQSSNPSLFTSTPFSQNTAQDQSVKSQYCNGETIVDTEAHFSIICPSPLTMYTYRDQYHPGLQKQEKIIFLCETQIVTDSNRNYYRCPAGGIMIWANGDGWGGGCDEKNKATITLGGKTRTYCISESHIAQLYAGDINTENSQDKYLLEGSFSPTFTKDEALKVLQSFQIL